MSYPDPEGKRTALATGALLLLPALCCGLLIAGGALAGLGSVLGNPWVIGAAVALVVGVAVWRVRRHTSSSSQSAEPDCCPPESPARDHSRPTTQSPTRHREQ